MPKVVDHGSAAFEALPRCPAHLNAVARREWRRLASALHSVRVLTVVDRAALAVYCQAYSRWVEAEEKLAITPMLLKTPTGYVQQSPWLAVANKQMELMARYMGELGLRATVTANADAHAVDLADILREIRSKGHETLRAIAAELYHRGILTRRGGPWHVSGVRNLIRRVDDVSGGRAGS